MQPRMLSNSTSVASSSAEKANTSKTGLAAKSESAKSVADPVGQKRSKAVVLETSVSSVKKKSPSKTKKSSASSGKLHSEKKKQRSTSLAPLRAKFEQFKRRHTTATQDVSSKTEAQPVPQNPEQPEKKPTDEEGTNEAYISAASILPFRKDLQKSLSTGCISSGSQYYDIFSQSSSKVNLQKSESNKLSDEEITTNPVISLDRIFLEFHLSPALEGETAESISAESIQQAFDTNKELTVHQTADIFNKPFPPNKEDWEKEFIEKRSIFACCIPKKKKRKRRRHQHRKRRRT